MSASLRMNLALTLIRTVIGLVFTAHGAQKVLGWFGGSGLAGFAGWLTGLGVPVYLSYAAAFFEFFGGLSLLLGICAEIGALLCVPVMIGAILLVHMKHGFFIQHNGIEYALVLLACLCAIILAGPGYALIKTY